VYSNGILVGETLPTALTTPVGVLPLAHGDWRWAIAMWSVIVLLSAAGIALAAPAGRSVVKGVASRWWPKLAREPGRAHRPGHGNGVSCLLRQQRVHPRLS